MTLWKENTLGSKGVPSSREIPNLKDLVKGNRVRFKYYRAKELWYEVSGFLFPVPIDDTGTGTFLAEDKAILFMRYIRKQLEALKTEGKHIHGRQ